MISLLFTYLFIYLFIYYLLIYCYCCFFSCCFKRGWTGVGMSGMELVPRGSPEEISTAVVSDFIASNPADRVWIDEQHMQLMMPFCLYSLALKDETTMEKRQVEFANM